MTVIVSGNFHIFKLMNSSKIINISVSFLLSFLMWNVNLAFAQEGFTLPQNQKKNRINIQVINNLPVIPVEINGAKLSFILDTGVKSTILFSLSKSDSLQINNTTEIELQGLGSGGTVPAIKSQNNIVRVGDAVDADHTLFVIFDQSINFSPRMGIPIHGILGSDFFQNFIVKLNYSNKYVILYNPALSKPKFCRNCEERVLRFYGNKPYLEVGIASNNKQITQLMLIDSGSSDALWLFDGSGLITDSPKNYFDDFLGLGLSGNIFGKRSRLDEVGFTKYKLSDVNVAFPENEFILAAKSNKERDGSLGGAFLKRFTVYFNYAEKKIWFKKNRDFKEPFYYDMSGLTIEHEGMDVVKELKQSSNFSQRSRTNEFANPDSGVTVSNYNYYAIKLVPKFIVAEIRDGSPAQIAGIISGDEIIAINGKRAFNFSLNELIEMFSKDEGKKVTVDILLKNIPFKFRFTLEKVL